MGVLSKLLETHQVAVAAIGQPAVAKLEPSREASWPTHWPEPAPCPVCASPGFWVDVYRGGPHCLGCNAPSSPSLVKMPVWVIDGDDGSPTGRRWVRNPRDESRYLPDTAADNGEWVAWRLPNGTRAFALRERVDHTRRANACGLYWPALACGPVGDLSLDDWFERLPSLREATPQRPRIEAAEGPSR